MAIDDTAGLRRERRTALLAGLGAAVRPEAPGGERPAGTGRYPREHGSAPASHGQAGLWFIDQFDSGDARYTVPFAFRLRGELNVPALQRAHTALVTRHSTLRTVFEEDDGQPVQRLRAPGPVPFEVIDLSKLTQGARLAEFEDRLAQEAGRAFDLADGPLFLATLLVMGPAEHVLVINVHHIVFDGSSLAPLLRDLCAVYRAEIAGEEPVLEPLTADFFDYAEWERGWLRGDECRRQGEYWRRRLEGTPRFRIPADRSRQITPAGASLTSKLPADVREALLRVAAEAGASPFMVLLAAFKVALARLAGQRDVVVGTAVANRSLHGTGDLVGYFVNSVVLRTDLRGDLSFAEVLRRVRETSLEAYENQGYPFSRLVAELEPRRDPGQSPLFQVMFVQQDEGWDRAQWPGLTVEPIDLPEMTSIFDVTLAIRVSDEGITGDFNFRTDLFEPTTIGALAGEFESVLRRGLSYPAELLLAAGRPSSGTSPADSVLPRTSSREIEAHG